MKQNYCVTYSESAHVPMAGALAILGDFLWGFP